MWRKKRDGQGARGRRWRTQRPGHGDTGRKRVHVHIPCIPPSGQRPFREKHAPLQRLTRGLALQYSHVVCRSSGAAEINHRSSNHSVLAMTFTRSLRAHLSLGVATFVLLIDTSLTIAFFSTTLLSLLILSDTRESFLALLPITWMVACAFLHYCISAILEMAVSYEACLRNVQADRKALIVRATEYFYDINNMSFVLSMPVAFDSVAGPLLEEYVGIPLFEDVQILVSMAFTLMWATQCIQQIDNIDILFFGWIVIFGGGSAVRISMDTLIGRFITVEEPAATPIYLAYLIFVSLFGAMCLVVLCGVPVLFLSDRRPGALQRSTFMTSCVQKVGYIVHLYAWVIFLNFVYPPLMLFGATLLLCFSSETGRPRILDPLKMLGDNAAVQRRKTLIAAGRHHLLTRFFPVCYPHPAILNAPTLSVVPKTEAPNMAFDPALEA